MAQWPVGAAWAPKIRKLVADLASPAGLEKFEPAVPALCQMLDRIVEWNARLDLTAARSADELVDLMLADAVVISELSAKEPPRSWVDVGSGAGAPGLPLALLQPGARFALVEPKTKRVAFLRSTLGALGRPDVEVLRARSEEVKGRQWEGAVSRATLPPEAWLREGARLATAAVWVLLARGAPPALAGWCVHRDHSYGWPLTGAARRLMVFAPTVPASGPG